MVIELDGNIHSLKDQKEYDEIRKEIMEVHKIRVLRIKNEEIENNIDGVLKRISSLTSLHLKSPSP
jgi:very-short-patch-repair endonuclease